MKLKAEVLSADTRGDFVRVTCQATARSDGQHTPYRSVAFDVRPSDGASYYVGAEVSVTIKPKRKP